MLLCLTKKNVFTAYNFSGRFFPVEHPDPTRRTLVLNETVLDGLVDFCDAVGWELVFGANLGTYRTAGATSEESSWDASAFRSLAQYVKRKGHAVAGWELGNEPDLMAKDHNISISPAVEARDFAEYARVLREELGAAAGRYRIIGPDTALTAQFTADGLSTAIVSVEALVAPTVDVPGGEEEGDDNTLVVVVAAVGGVAAVVVVVLATSRRRRRAAAVNCLPCPCPCRRLTRPM